MSDSYTAWCEQQERNARMFSEKNVNSIKNTIKFKKLLKQTKDACGSTKLCKAKSCQNCMHRIWLNSKDICEKLGIVLKDDDLVCKKWSGAPYTPAQPKLNEDVIAWLIIQKHKFDYGY